jgi:Lysophospholipase
VNKESLVFDAATGGGNKIAAFFCPTDVKKDGKSKGVIQICHGMADYFGRYDEMTEYLNGAGFDVCGMDMMGHGQTYELNKQNDMPLGYFGDSDDSAMCILKDEMTLHGKAKERFGSDIPYIIYGHSMGSFVVRNIYITPEYAREFDAFVFASTMGSNPAVGLGIMMSQQESRIFGRKKRPGKVLDKIAFRTYNKRIDNPKTNFDWVSSDEAAVAKYVQDPHAGFMFTNKGFNDLFKLVERMQRKDAYDHVDPGKAVFIPYGEDDPVGDYGEGVRDVCEILRSKGIIVMERSYGHYRHEIQNESVRWVYFKDIAEFCEWATT